MPLGVKKKKLLTGSEMEHLWDCRKFETFSELFARMADKAKPGPDGIPGVVWRHVPHSVKCQLYKLFAQRIKDISWLDADVETWQQFELLGIPKQSIPQSFKDFRWLGILDQVFKLYAAVINETAKPCMSPLTRARSFGCKRCASVEDCFGALFEAVSFAGKWGISLVLGAQDVETAFDSVRHVDVLQTIRRAGATPHQALAIAREMANNLVTLRMPGVATTEPIQMSKALRTGGRSEPLIFARMFDEVLDAMEWEWELLGVGFSLPDTGERIASITWVDNNFLLANDFKEYEFMSSALTGVLKDRYNWHWKASSLEMLQVHVAETKCGNFGFAAGDAHISFKIVEEMVALGDVLSAAKPSEALLRHRLAKGEASFHKYRRHLVGKAPVSL